MAQNKAKTAIGKNIAKLLGEKGLTQTALAEKLNISQSVVSNWIKGLVDPSLENTIAISQIFHVSLDELVFGKSDSINESSENVKNDSLLINGDLQKIWESFAKLSIYANIEIVGNYDSEKLVSNSVPQEITLKISPKGYGVHVVNMPYTKYKEITNPDFSLENEKNELISNGIKPDGIDLFLDHAFEMVCVSDYVMKDAMENVTVPESEKELLKSDKPIYIWDIRASYTQLFLIQLCFAQKMHLDYKPFILNLLNEMGDNANYVDDTDPRDFLLMDISLDDIMARYKDDNFMSLPGDLYSSSYENGKFTNINRFLTHCPLQNVKAKIKWF